MFIINAKKIDNGIKNGNNTKLHVKSTPSSLALASIPLIQKPIIKALKLFSTFAPPNQKSVVKHNPVLFYSIHLLHRL